MLLATLALAAHGGVLDGLEVGPDGTLYVTTLTGDALLAGGAGRPFLELTRLPRGQRVRHLALADDGAVLLQIAGSEPGPDGRVWGRQVDRALRVDGSGKATEVDTPASHRPLFEVGGPGTRGADGAIWRSPDGVVLERVVSGSTERTWATPPALWADAAKARRAKPRIHGLAVCGADLLLAGGATRTVYRYAPATAELTEVVKVEDAELWGVECGPGDLAYVLVQPIGSSEVGVHRIDDGALTPISTFAAR